MLLFHNVSAYVAHYTSSYPFYIRISFHGIMLVYAFCALLILQSKVLLVRRIGLCVILLCVWFSALADVRGQEIWKISLDNELRYRNRIFTRIEMDEHFKYDKQYNLIQFGTGPIWTEKYLQGFDRSTLELARPYDLIGAEGQFFSLISHNITPLSAGMPTYMAMLKTYKDSLLDMKSWPAKNSIKVFGDTIFVVLDEKALHATLEQIKVHDKAPQ